MPIRLVWLNLLLLSSFVRKSLIKQIPQLPNVLSNGFLTFPLIEVQGVEVLSGILLEN